MVFRLYFVLYVSYKVRLFYSSWLPGQLWPMEERWPRTTWTADVQDSVAEKRLSPWLGWLLEVDARLGLRGELRRGGASERWSQVGDSRVHCCPPPHCSSREAPLQLLGLFVEFTLQSVPRQATSFSFARWHFFVAKIELKSVKFWLLRWFFYYSVNWRCWLFFFGYWIGGSIGIPRRDSVAFVSAIGHLDRRVDLFKVLIWGEQLKIFLEVAFKRLQTCHGPLH